MELIFSTKAGGNVVSMPKMIPIFFTHTPSMGNTPPAYARLPFLLETPRTKAGSSCDQSLFILSESTAVCKRGSRDCCSGYWPHKIFLYAKHAPAAACGRSNRLGDLPVRSRQHGSDIQASGMANTARLRHHLFRLGIDLPRHPRGRARGATVSPRGNALLRRRHRPLCMDAGARHSIAHDPRVACRHRG